MAFGDLLAEFYTNANPPVSQGIITTVVDAGGGLALNEITENNFCLLPNQMPAADHAKIVDGGICHVYIEDDVAAGGSTDICTFIIEKKVVEGSGRNTFLRLSGPDQLREMRERLVNKIISKEETGTAQDTSPTTITLAAGTPDRTGWTVSVPATQPHDQGIVIESHDTGSQVATLAFGWTPTPSSNTTYKLSEGIADPTDLNSIATQLNPFASGIWTLEVEGGNTGTANGSYVVGKGESVLRILQIVQEQSLGEFFRLKSLTPSVRTVEWRRTNASSGITITGDKSLYSNPAYALVVPGTMQAERVDRRFTRIYPYGAGMGPSSLTVISSTINPATLYTGFALINDAAFPGINNTSIETATFHRGAIKTFAEIQAANGTATQQVAAANALMRAAAYWLKQHDGFVWEYRCSVYSHSTLKPGDTIDISWTDPGQNPQTITATGLYIQSAKSRVQKGQKIADLYLTATFLPSNEDTKTVGNHLRTMMGTLRHSEASIGTVSTGGGVIGAHDHAYLPLSGGNLTGNVTLDVDVLVDGRDISDDGATLDTIAPLAHAAMTVASSTPAGVLTASGQALTLELTGTNLPEHDILDLHSYVGGSALDVVGLSAPDTLAILTPSYDTSGGGSYILRSDSSGDFKARRLDVSQRYEVGGNNGLFVDGNNNVFVGNTAAPDNITVANSNLGIGTTSLNSLTSGLFNMALGPGTFFYITTQSRGTAIGVNAAFNVTNDDGLYIGYNAGVDSNGWATWAVGNYAARLIQTDQAFAGGYQALYSATTALYPFAFGFQSLRSLIDGDYNMGMGNYAGYSQVSGNRNTYIAYHSGFAATSGDDNFVAGVSTGESMSGSRNLIGGNYAGQYINSDDNTIWGHGTAQYAGSVSGTITGVSLFGTAVAPNLRSGYVSGFGYHALFRVLGVDKADAFGAFALQNLLDGQKNSAFGESAGSAQQHGSNNFYGGYGSGFSHTGSYSVFLGTQAGWEETDSYKLYIASDATTNPLVYGIFPNTLFRMAAATVEMGDNSSATTLRNRATDLTVDVEGGDLYLLETRLTTKTGSGDGGQLRVCAVELVGNFATSSGTGSDTGVKPNADHSSSGVTGSYADISDDPDAPNTGNYVYNTGSAAGYKFFGLDSMDASFVAWSYLQIKIYVTSSGFLTDSARVYAQVFQSDETTTLTKEVLLAEQNGSGLYSANFGWTRGDKTTWDAARLRLRWTYNSAASTPGTWRSNSTLLLNQTGEDSYIEMKGESIGILLSVGHDAVTVGATQPEYIDSDVGFAVIDNNLLVSNSGQSSEFNLWCYNNGDTSAIPAWRTRAARGTRGEPAASQAGDVLGRFGAAGFGYTYFPNTSRGYLQFQAGEDWDDASHGTYATIATTANGNTSPAVRLYINDAGISTNSGTDSWKFGGRTAGSDAAINGYMTITHNGSTYKLATIA